jgi:hypothetical protein
LLRLAVDAPKQEVVVTSLFKEARPQRSGVNISTFDFQGGRVREIQRKRVREKEREKKEREKGRSSLTLIYHECLGC